MSVPLYTPAWAAARGTCEVRIQCGDIAASDRFISAEIGGSMTMGEAQTLFSRTMNAAAKISPDFHNRESVSVCVTLNRDAA